MKEHEVILTRGDYFIDREHASELAGPKELRKFRNEVLRHHAKILKAMRELDKAMRGKETNPSALHLMNSQFNKLTRNMGPCRCTVTTKMGMVCGEDDCSVHGFGDY